MTPTPSASVAAIPPALLFIEPASKSTAIATYISNDPGADTTFPNFFGFNSGIAAESSNNLEIWMKMYSTSGVTGLPQIYEADIPQSGGRQYLFDEIEVPNGTVNESAWYIVAIPQDAIGSETNRMTQIEYGTTNSFGTTLNLSSDLYQYGVNYVGAVFENVEYRLYSTWNDTGMQINNTSSDVFLRGGTVE